MDTNAVNDPSLSQELEAHPLRGLATISATPRVPGQVGSLDWRQALGIGLIVLGIISVIVAWYGVSGTLDPGKQMPYISSGGFGGAVLIAIGVTLLSSFDHARDRAALEVILDRLDAIDWRIHDMEVSRIQEMEAEREEQKVIVLDDPAPIERRPGATGATRPAARTTRSTSARSTSARSTSGGAKNSGTATRTSVRS